MKTETAIAVAGVGLALAVGVALWLTRPGAVQNLAAGAVGAVGEAASGTVLGIGDAVGIPRTSQTECDRALAEGRTWDASFACPAKRFLTSLWS